MEGGKTKEFTMGASTGRNRGTFYGSFYESLLRATFRTRPGEHVRRVRYSSFFLFLFFFFLYIHTRVCILSHLARPVLDIIAYPRCLWKNRDGVDAVSSRCPLPGRLDNLSSSLFFSFLLFQLIPTRETGREREREKERGKRRLLTR